MGIKASFAVTLDDGEKRLDEGGYQILFLDNNLPDGSGLEHLSDLKQKFPKLKIIMISAWDGEKERETAHLNGAVDFIGKPLSGKAIRASLKNHFTALNI
jgi:DNA-binding response OmpR family regulator